MREAETKLLETPPSIEPITDELPITLPPPSSSAKSSELVKQVTAAAEKVSDTYNGAEMDNYKWSQTLLDLDIRVPVSKGTKSKDVRVDIKSDRLKVELIRPRRKVGTETEYSLLYSGKYYREIFKAFNFHGTASENISLNKFHAILYVNVRCVRC